MKDIMVQQIIITKDAGSVRASISFPPEIYEDLKRLARQKKVSLAWIVRDAVECYVSENEAKKDQG